nr:NADH dehydrogenase subunit 6 [Sachalinobia koltzei]
MLCMLLSSLLFLFSFMFLFLSHPLSFGLILLMQTILISLITGYMNYNFWFSYILFLIMIGGMLILFIYMTSIASNEKFKFSFKLFLLFNLIFFSILMLIFIDSFFFNLNLNSYDLMNQNDSFFNYFSLMKYFNKPNMMLTYLMINYLLITLIAIVKITKIQSGPLRQKN